MSKDLLSRFESLNAEVMTIERRKNNPAGYMHERLSILIDAQQQALDANMELGALVVGGGSYSFHLRQISFSNPDILIFEGVDSEGNAVQLMQHYTQMGIVLISLPKLEEKAYRIGFTS